MRVQIDEGRTDDEIRQFFVDRYGERVLAAPPREGFHWLVWAAPPVGVVLALLTLFWVTQAMGRRPPEPPLAEGDADADLAPYLRQVDRELSIPAAHARGPWARTPVRPEGLEAHKRNPRRTRSAWRTSARYRLPGESRDPGAR